MMHSDMYNCSGKSIAPCSRNWRKASLNGKGFHCNLFGYILQTIGLDLMVSMGPIETAEKQFIRC